MKASFQLRLYAILCHVWGDAVATVGIPNGSFLRLRYLPHDAPEEEVAPEDIRFQSL